MLKGPIHACSLQKRTKETHKLASSFFVKYTGSLLQVTHTDGAFEHMRQFGFCDQLVRETMKELLKVGFYFIFFLFLLKQGHSWDPALQRLQCHIHCLRQGSYLQTRIFYI